MSSEGVRRVRYLKSVGAMRLEDEGPETDAPAISHWRLAGGFLTPVEVAKAIALSTLRQALREAAHDRPGIYTPGSQFPLHPGASLMLADSEIGDFDNKWSPVLATCIEVTGEGELVVRIEFGISHEDFSVARLRALIGPALRDAGAKLVDAVDDGSEGPWAGNPWPWAMWIAPAVRGQTVGSALALADRIRRVLDSTDGRPIDLEAALDLLRAGEAPAIYGLKENHWLEAKSRGYPLQTEQGKIELGQDAARFANSEAGGLLIIGLATRKSEATETLVKGPGLEFGTEQARRYRQIIDNRVFPPIEGLLVESVPDGHGASNGLLLIHVPAQPGELKPFLVHGAIVGGKTEGAFISIIRRRGEQSIPVRPESIHAALAAGLALLRSRGETNQERP